MGVRFFPNWVLCRRVTVACSRNPCLNPNVDSRGLRDWAQRGVTSKLGALESRSSALPRKEASTQSAACESLQLHYVPEGGCRMRSRREHLCLHHSTKPMASNELKNFSISRSANGTGNVDLAAHLANVRAQAELRTVPYP